MADCSLSASLLFSVALSVFFVFFISYPSLYLLSLTFLFSLPLHPQLFSSPGGGSFVSLVLGTRSHIRRFVFCVFPECSGLVLSRRL